MATIQIRSIQEAISNGTLIALADDYRTSRFLRASLPRQSRCAFVISPAAFNRYLQQGELREKQSRIEAVCAFFNKILGLRGTPSQSDLEFRFPGEDEVPGVYSLKLEWYARDNSWVMLLPDEQIAPGLKLA